MLKRITGALVVVLLLILGGSAAPAQAAASGSDFALVCDLNDSYRARVDLKNVKITQIGAKVDADDIWWRALNHKNKPVSIRVEKVLIQLYDAAAEKWVSWTAKGGTASDGKTVAPSVHWNPKSKLNLKANYTGIRLKAYYNGSSCKSKPRFR